MRKLNRKRPIIGEDVPRRVEKIIEKLFPRKRTDTVSDYRGWCIEDVEFPEITTEDISEELKGLPNSNAPGPDGIKNELFKIIQVDRVSAQHIFNRCLKEAHFPIAWKKANLVLLHKL